MKDVIKELVGWIVSILLIVAVSYLIVTFVGQRTQVSGSSMETTLSDGDHLIVDKISYRFWSRSVTRSLYFRTDMKKILTILNGSSDFRGKRFRL
ncbi:hypothetical protein Rumi1_15550 [[Ruminococcus] torques]|nr:hypothetical protein Rumi1_15550 [[Ruminococcus] torques]